MYVCIYIHMNIYIYICEYLLEVNIYIFLFIIRKP
jgi:hypothetical protein